MSSNSTDAHEYEYCPDRMILMSIYEYTYKYALIPAKHALSALRLLRVCSAFAPLFQA